MSKNHSYTILHIVILLLVGILSPLTAQVQSGIETEIVDALAQLPAQDEEQLNGVLEGVLELEEEGIMALANRLVPPGAGNDKEARYLLHSLATYAGSPTTGKSIKKMVEDSLLKALEEVEDKEIKTFLIRRLAFCGSDTSVGNLSPYLSDMTLFKPALATMTFIGTEKAGSEILKAVSTEAEEIRRPCIRALGDLAYAPALETLHKISDEYDRETVRFTLYAISEIGDPSSHKILLKAAKSAEFKTDDSGAVIAYVNYGNRLVEGEYFELVTKIGNNLLKNCLAPDQLQFRAAGIHLLSKSMGKDFNDLLIEEIANNDSSYRGAVLGAIHQPMTGEEIDSWIRACVEAATEAKPQIITTIGKTADDSIMGLCLSPALDHQSEEVRLSAITMMAFQDKSAAMGRLLEKLEGVNSEPELQAIEATLLSICGREDHMILAEKLPQLPDESQAVVVNVLGARAATEQFDVVSTLAFKGNSALDESVFNALGAVATANDIDRLFELLSSAEREKDIQALQQAILTIADYSAPHLDNAILAAYDSSEEKIKIAPLLVAVSSEEALDRVIDMMTYGTEIERRIALKTLSVWRDNDAIPYLYAELKDSANPEERSLAFTAYLRQVGLADLPDDQKLLLIRKVSHADNSLEEKQSILRACRSIHTFLSLYFVSGFLDDEDLRSEASGTAIAIALPTPTFEGLNGDVVRDIVSRSIDNLTGQDSQYLKIDVREFLENMSTEKGYLPIFNGRDLSGWQGLAADPLKRSKMTEDQIIEKQADADAQLTSDWVVENGILKFIGEGFNNICSVKKYGDFELLIDWRIMENGDSGIYLRGTPQVQIWDTGLTDEGAEVGSGGLYNNQTHPDKPLLVADNPVNEWNTFRISMVGEKVTVYLNGLLVTDQVIMENYWNRELPVFERGAIELQAHKEPVEFRNIFVKELDHGSAGLDPREMEEGFVSLFNGKNLDQWTGNKEDYVVENGELIVMPEKGAHGNLYSIKEYSDFVIRFEFQLTPGANNGFGFHAPLEGDAAYVGKESQILDNSAAIYANIKAYQSHASIYGVMPAEKGYLSPVGEWNEQEIEVRGDDVKITLNGTVILEGNLKTAAKNGTLDGKDHPGLNRNKGHIGFLGHGSELKFRNIRIKDLSNN